MREVIYFSEEVKNPLVLVILVSLEILMTWLTGQIQGFLTDDDYKGLNISRLETRTKESGLFARGNIKYMTPKWK